MRLRGPLKSSANAGQFSQDLFGKVGLKQYYSAAQIMRGVEPIPQAGFDLLPGSADLGSVLSPTCKMGVLKVRAGLSYVMVVSAGKVEIWRNDRVKRATLTIAAITAGMIPDLGFWGEANTFGIFHPALNAVGGLRLFRNAADDTSWTVDAWPLEFIPEVDLGGTYTKTDDVWDIYLRWANSPPGLVVSCTVDGVDTAAITLYDNLDNPTGPEGADVDWARLATDMTAAIAALPGFSSGVSIVYNASGSSNNYRSFTVTFGGALKGAEYDFDTQVLNTADASTLVAHVQVGETAGEPLVSISRGGFAGMGMYQNRAVYYAPDVRKAALAMSETAEYFNLNIKAVKDSGARLEALLTSTSQTIHHVLDNTYLLVFTDQAEWFASNRTVKRNEPLNFVCASEIGSKKNCRPVNVDGLVFFVSPDGGILYSIVYDAVGTTYTPTPENDLCKDLVANVRDQVLQRKIGSSTSSRNWILREDGRLVCLIVNKAREQNIIAPAEWGVHGGGLVKAHAVDGSEQVWLVVERGGAARVEVMEEASTNLLQAAIRVTTDAAGVASGLSVHNGRTVWAQIDGDFHGPFTVSGGQVTISDAPSRPAIIGLWEPPVYESMPYVRVLQDDSVVKRPGAVKAASLYLLDTTSIAVGANGRPARDVPLNRMSDDLSAPKSGFTGDVLVAGLNGVSKAPTITITQVRPGRLRLRDYVPGAKL